MTLSNGGSTRIDIPWTEPKEPSGGRYGVLNRHVAVGPRQKTVAELCQLLTTETKPDFRITADPELENETIALEFEERLIWDVLESLYLEKGWIVTEGGDKSLVLHPGP